MKKFTFLIPVFNDWDSLSFLLGRIDQEISSYEDIFDVVIVNDGSTIKRSISVENVQHQSIYENL